MSKAIEIMDAVLTTFRARTWTTITPVQFHFGPLPPALNGPSVGIIMTTQVPADEAAFTNTAWEDFTIAAFFPLNVADTEQHLRDALGWRNEVWSLIEGTDDWGVSGVDSVMFAGSETNLGVDQTTNGYVLEIQVNFRCRYTDTF